MVNSNIIGRKEENLNPFVARKINYTAITKDINKRWKTEYNSNYIRNVHKGVQFSMKLLTEIKKLLNEGGE